MEKGEIWIVQFYSKKGREQEGTRPAIIIADTKTDLVLLIPLASNLEALKKLPFILEVKRSHENNLDKNSVVLIFQIQALDKRRLKNKIGKLEENKMDEIDKILKKMFNL